jgi:hypothetical protein
MYFDNCKSKEEVIVKYQRFGACIESDQGIINEIQEEYNKRINSNAESPKVGPIGSLSDRLEKMLKWAETQPTFDKKFILSLWEKVEKGFTLSEKQIGAFENIVKRFKLDI